MRYLMGILFILGLSEVSAEAFTITTISSGCGVQIPGQQFVAVGGPGIEARQSDVGGCIPSHPPFGAAAGETVLVHWFTAGTAVGTVDGRALQVFNSPPCFAAPYVGALCLRGS